MMESINPNLTTLEQLRGNSPDELVCVASHSCWWCLLVNNPYATATGLPLDPLGSPLMQSPIIEFIGQAVANPNHYGKHGLKAFELAYHGNVLDELGQPTALKGWDKYNDLIDLAIVEGSSYYDGHAKLS